MYVISYNNLTFSNFRASAQKANVQACRDLAYETDRKLSSLDLAANLKAHSMLVLMNQTLLTFMA